LYAGWQELLGPAERRRFRHVVRRRVSGIPTAYLLGRREFYGVELAVDRRVLIPRPETETLVEAALAWAARHRVETAADIGTGSGAIAIALALHLPRARVYATDLSREALAVARKNIRALGLQRQVRLLWGDLGEPLPEPVDLIVANLPYVPTAEMAETGEPPLARDGGTGGLDLIRRLLQQAPPWLRAGGAVLLEIDPRQAEAVAALGKQHLGADTAFARDLAGRVRVATVGPVQAVNGWPPQAG
ncbi:MAG: peptide chain release factor N(5)-glutamine methyltransferase, partial [Chloroflexi bacterium]|nr:peptide chain release factor N(5)-glutamine methyltransferase [Chloroflexota bacterium]